MDLYEKSKYNTQRYKKIKVLLKKIYGYDNFRKHQYEIINRIINNEDVCAIMSTGHGKSICFQIPALYLNKPAIIISPLISLMDDQKMILEELGIPCCCYNSNIDNRNIVKKNILEAKYKFIYITPESIIYMKDFLQNLYSKQGISLIAIDEAHCISSYGFDFRKSYRDLNFLKEILPNVPILALTATATNVVSEDICKVLNLKTKEPIKTSFDRPNLYLEVNKKINIADDILPIIKKYKNEPIIIYCLTKKETEKIAGLLKNYKIECGIYHASINTTEKNKTHYNFIKGKINIIVATIAFGMGINKSNIRVIIHYGAPKNIEGYYQEIGRAGRDGKKSYCYMFYNMIDFKIHEHFIGNSRDDKYKKTQRELLENIKQYVMKNICRRKLLLEYFGEEYNNKCDFCDNCCGKKEIIKQISVIEQDVKKEVKMLIDLMESFTNRIYGIGMYINILRGSKNKSINSVIKKNEFYGNGKHKSVLWWKELIENLIKLKFIEKIFLRGKISMQVIKVTNEGLKWSHGNELSEYMNVETKKLPLIKMVNRV